MIYYRCRLGAGPFLLLQPLINPHGGAAGGKVMETTRLPKGGAQRPSKAVDDLEICHKPQDPVQVRQALLLT